MGSVMRILLVLAAAAAMSLTLLMPAAQADCAGYAKEPGRGDMRPLSLRCEKAPKRSHWTRKHVRPNTEPMMGDGPVYACKGTGPETAFKAPADVWWGHKNRSYGNYVAFNKPQIPVPAPEPVVAKPYPPFDPIYFDLDKAVLRPNGIRIARQVLDYMKENPGKTVTVEGHCCDLATDAYNIKLGERRAMAVKSFLVKNGIDPGRIKTVTYGEERRVTTDPDKRELNRRAIVIVRAG